MKRGTLFLILAVSLSGLAGTIQIIPSPTSLKGEFQVCVPGIQAEAGDVLVVNVRTGEQVRVPLADAGGRLVAGPIHVLRPCDRRPEEAKYVLHVEVGDVIAAATEVEGGLSTTTAVAPPQGEATLDLATWEESVSTWCSHTLGAELLPGRLRVTIEDPTKDLYCKEESINLKLKLGGSETRMDVRESGPATGRFIAELELAVEPSGADLVVRLIHEGSELLSVPLSEAAALNIAYGGLIQTFPVAGLETALGLDPGPREDAGCPIRVTVVVPGYPDEVLWFVDGGQLSEHGPELRVVRDEPSYPALLQVTALVRVGSLWGKTSATLSFVPKTQIAIVQAETGEPIQGAAECGTVLRAKLSFAYDDEAPQVWVGLLGPACSVPRFGLEPQGNGVYLSEPFRPEELGACSGDVLWAQYTDPTCPEDVAWVLLPLK